MPDHAKQGSDVLQEVTKEEPYQDKYWWKGRQQYYDTDEMAIMEMEQELCAEGGLICCQA